MSCTVPRTVKNCGLTEIRTYFRVLAVRVTVKTLRLDENMGLNGHVEAVTWLK